MKKTLIASAASLALAAMPVIGVFADQAANPAALTDNLTVNVNGICTFTRSNGTGNYTQTMTANDLNAEFGVSTFSSNCNNGTGYKVSFVGTPLSHSTGDGTAISYSDTTPTQGSGTWTAYRSATTGGVIAEGYATAANLVSGAGNGTAYQTTAADTSTASSFTITYKVATNTVQAQGSYSGTATYTLAQNAATE